MRQLIERRTFGTLANVIKHEVLIRDKLRLLERATWQFEHRRVVEDALESGDLLERGKEFDVVDQGLCHQETEHALGIEDKPREGKGANCGGIIQI